MNAYYHVRYWWHVAKRLVRWPFSSWARHGIPIDEYIADIERDPKMRQEMAKAREWARTVFP